MIADFSLGKRKEGRREWNNMFKVQKGKKEGGRETLSSDISFHAEGNRCFPINEN